jgi:uncharacterized oxidoreductase
MKISNNKILITGGGSGIGLGLTERFIAENNTVIICGRRASKLEEVKAQLPNVITKVCDITSEQDRTALYEWIKTEHSDLNVLINNAGIQNWMGVDDTQFYQKALDEINTNIIAALHLNTLFTELPKLDTLINVTSGLAFTPLSKVPVYCATKAFMRSYTVSLRYLLKQKGIEVIEMIPPALNTDLGAPGIHTQYPPVSDFVASIFEQLKEGKAELSFGTSTDRLNANNDTTLKYVEMMNSRP